MSDITPTTSSPLIQDMENDNAYDSEVSQEAEDNLFDVETGQTPELIDPGTIGESPIAESPGTIAESPGTVAESPGTVTP